jgi:hypothetical protein
VELPDDIHFEIAKIFDPRLCSSPSSQHADDPDITPLACRQCRPNRTLINLTLVCKRLCRIYAPYSTWRSVYIEANSPKLAQRLGEKYEPSPSITRVLNYPETGVYARELLIQYNGFKMWRFNMNNFDKNGFTMARGNLANLDRFLANTPQLETVRCISSDEEELNHTYYEDERIDVRLPVEFFVSLSKVASLRYLYLGEFNMDSCAYYPSSLPALLPQVRILRYSPSTGRTVLANLLYFLMPNIHTLYITGSRYLRDKEIDCILCDLEVRCHFPSVFLSPFLTIFLFGTSISQAPPC